jgi:hypothetical protein
LWRPRSLQPNKKPQGKRLGLAAAAFDLATIATSEYHNYLLTSEIAGGYYPTTQESVKKKVCLGPMGQLLRKDQRL